MGSTHSATSRSRLATPAGSTTPRRARRAPRHGYSSPWRYGGATMPREIGRDEVRRLMDQGSAVVKVLPANEYLQDHLPRAINLPLRKLDTGALARLDPTRPVVVYSGDRA